VKMRPKNQHSSYLPAQLRVNEDDTYQLLIKCFRSNRCTVAHILGAAGRLTPEGILRTESHHVGPFPAFPPRFTRSEASEHGQIL
jgi:hypothetical protein